MERFFRLLKRKPIIVRFFEKLEFFDKFVIRFVGSDPKPDHLFTMPASKRTVADSDPDGIDRFFLVNALEMKTRVVRIHFPLPVSPLCLFPDAFRKKRERLPESVGGMGLHFLRTEKSNGVVFPFSNSCRASSASLAS